MPIKKKYFQSNTCLLFRTHASQWVGTNFAQYPQKIIINTITNSCFYIETVKSDADYLSSIGHILV